MSTSGTDDPRVALTRRGWLAGGLAVASALALPARAALPRTPVSTAGPYYPPAFEASAGADLTAMGAGAPAARGEPLALRGRVLASDGTPLAGVRVEIWQCNADGRYHHPADRSEAPLDPGFRGYGATRAAADGSYGFRTIRPVPYSGRTPHVHLRVRRAAGIALTTQVYFEDSPGNGRDFLYGRLDRDEQALVTVSPMRTAAGWQARFDVVI